MANEQQQKAERQQCLTHGLSEKHLATAEACGFAARDVLATVTRHGQAGVDVLRDVLAHIDPSLAREAAQKAKEGPCDPRKQP